MTMSRHIYAIILAAILTVPSGCARDKVRGPAPAELISNIRTISVVAVQGPVAFAQLYDGKGPSGNDIISLGQITGGIALPFAAASAIYEEQEANRIGNAMVKTGQTWEPTLALAHHIADRISAHDDLKAVVQDGVKSLGVATERQGFFNALAWDLARARWFNATVSPFDYKGLKALGFDVVLEVGLEVISVHNDSILVIALAKLVDPSNGSVIGSARSEQNKGVKLSRSTALQDGGRNLREEVEQVGRRAIDECVKALGLLL
jgi:hypothetical protein